MKCHISNSMIDWYSPVVQELCFPMMKLLQVLAMVITPAIL